MNKVFDTIIHFKWFKVTYKTYKGVNIVLSVECDCLPLNFDKIESDPAYKELYDHIVAAMNNNAASEQEKSLDRKLMEHINVITSNYQHSNNFDL